MASHFIADLHLRPGSAGQAAVLQRYLAGPARTADALYILGDLFEVWVGDDGSLPAHRETVAAVRALADSGVACFFMRGNRDFAVGPDFAAAAGITLIDDPTSIRLGAFQIVLTHGDRLCTDDHEHQRFRARYTDPDWLARMLALPLWLRRAIARYGRLRSRYSKPRKRAEIMDVNPAAVGAFMHKHKAALLIHGHTHRPGDHKLGVAGHRLVLSDWHPQRGEVLSVDAQGWRRLELR